jgi:hypothetical protein
MVNLEKWQQLNNDSSGYVGEKRNEVEEGRDLKYGKGNWLMGWLYGETVLDYVEVCRVYEDGYYEYLKQRPEILEHLCGIASEVYDDDITNINSKQDYRLKGDIRTHIQDIAIRRCLIRFGRTFNGKEPVQIRDKNGRESVSKTLSPGQVPFHRQNLISIPDNLKEIYKTRWWLPGSVEDFYQLNKRLFLKK